MNCGYQLRWYDLVPLFSYLALGGRCRKCKAHISVQYPIIEALNGVLYLLVFWKFGMSVDSLVYCLLFSALLALSVIDFRTYEIPVGFNVFYWHWGWSMEPSTIHSGWISWSASCVSVYFYLFCITLPVAEPLAAVMWSWWRSADCCSAGNWSFCILLGCIIGSVIHLIRMKVSGEGHVLAMGPYLSAGVAVAVLWGNEFLQWYLGLYH